ncbi:MAG TPA: hypothetical protein VF824_18145 [Thermoanaerobaculia bacterium]|jgi:hypothetical protein
MAAATFAIVSRRAERARRIQTAQHSVAAIILISTGWQHLSRGHGLELVPLLEVLAGATLLIAVLVDRVRHVHTRVGWVELAGAAMLFAEAVARLFEPHHLSFYVASFIPPCMLLAFAIFDERIRSRRRLEVNDDGVLMQTRLFWPKRVPWSGMRSYRITPERVELAREDGTRDAISLRDVANRDEAVAWLTAQFEKRGLRAD